MVNQVSEFVCPFGGKCRMVNQVREKLYPGAIFCHKCRMEVWISISGNGNHCIIKDVELSPCVIPQQAPSLRV